MRIVELALNPTLALINLKRQFKRTHIPAQLIHSDPPFTSLPPPPPLLPPTLPPNNRAPASTSSSSSTLANPYSLSSRASSGCGSYLPPSPPSSVSPPSLLRTHNAWPRKAACYPCQLPPPPPPPLLPPPHSPPCSAILPISGWTLMAFLVCLCVHFSLSWTARKALC